MAGCWNAGLLLPGHTPRELQVSAGLLTLGRRRDRHQEENRGLLAAALAVTTRPQDPHRGDEHQAQVDSRFL